MLPNNLRHIHTGLYPHAIHNPPKMETKILKYRFVSTNHSWIEFLLFVLLCVVVYGKLDVAGGVGVVGCFGEHGHLYYPSISSLVWGTWQSCMLFYSYCPVCSHTSLTNIYHESPNVVLFLDSYIISYSQGKCYSSSHLDGRNANSNNSLNAVHISSFSYSPLLPPSHQSSLRHSMANVDGAVSCQCPCGAATGFGGMEVNASEAVPCYLRSIGCLSLSPFP